MPTLTKTVTKDKYGVVPVDASSDQGDCSCKECSTLAKFNWTNFIILFSGVLLNLAMYMLFQGVLVLVNLLQRRKAKTLRRKEKRAVGIREVIRLEIEDEKGQEKEIEEL